MERGQAGGGIAQHCFICDRVPAVDALGLVADQLHGGLPVDTNPSQVPRVGDLRVYYAVEEKPGPVVVIVAVGIKVRERITIAGKDIKP